MNDTINIKNNNNNPQQTKEYKLIIKKYFVSYNENTTKGRLTYSTRSMCLSESRPHSAACPSGTVLLLLLGPALALAPRPWHTQRHTH